MVLLFPIGAQLGERLFPNKAIPARIWAPHRPQVIESNQQDLGLKSFLDDNSPARGNERYVASYRPECSAVRPNLKLANSWQIGFLRSIPKEGKSENSHVFTGVSDSRHR